VLQELALATKESASYYVLHGDEQRMCLYRAEPSEGLRETRLPGTILPLDDTAIGSVLKYWGKEEESAKRDEALPWFTAGVRDLYTAAFAKPLRRAHAGGQCRLAVDQQEDRDSATIAATPANARL